MTPVRGPRVTPLQAPRVTPTRSPRAPSTTWLPRVMPSRGSRHRRPATRLREGHARLAIADGDAFAHEADGRIRGLQRLQAKAALVVLGPLQRLLGLLEVTQ